jgi:uncharacterized membrane protein
VLTDRNPQHWKFPVLYFNSENPHLFVPKRTGLPLTLNFARPPAWWIAVPVAVGFAFAMIANNR